MNNKPIIICASGASLPFLNSKFYKDRHGMPLELERIIKHNYSIGLNCFYKYGCATTFNSFADWQFYENNYNDLKNLSLIVGSHDPSLQRKDFSKIHDNTILLKNSGKYNGKDSISLGVFSKQLIGIWSLSLAIALGFKEIYLLGYDCCEVNGYTHFYEGVCNLNKTTPIYLKGKLRDNRLHFRGVGKNEKGEYKTSTYNSKKHLNKKWFAPFLQEKDVKIYNVSPESAIDVFPKIGYDEFYERFKNQSIDQMQAREDIKEFILEKKK